MPELIAKSALFGQDPVTYATGTPSEVTLSEADAGPITSIACFPGTRTKVTKALGGFPKPNRFLDTPLRVWTGPEQAFLIGAEPPSGLEDIAAVTDQSGGWAVLELSGPGAEAVLARRYPLDLRPKSFPTGSAARAPLGHMQSVLMRLAKDHYRVMVFRSMARTAWHELDEAAQNLAARAAI